MSNVPVTTFDPDGLTPKPFIRIDEFILRVEAKRKSYLQLNALRSSLRVRESSKGAASAAAGDRAAAESEGFSERFVGRALFGKHAAKGGLYLDSMDQHAEAFAASWQDFYRHTLSGEEAWADLDAIEITTQMMQATGGGSVFVMYATLDLLLLVPNFAN